MTDFLIEKELAQPRATLLDQVHDADRVRVHQEIWKQLRPVRIEVFTFDGQSIELDALDDLTDWFRRHDPANVKTLIVNWGESSGYLNPGTFRIALTLGQGARMWIGGPDEAAIRGMSQLMLDALGERGPRLQRPISPLSHHQDVGAAPPRALRRFWSDPWVIAVGSGVILLGVGSLFRS